MQSTQEIWKDIAGYDGFYQISSLGRVRNSKGLIKKLKLWGGNKENRYNSVCLKKKNHKTMYPSVHRLVAQAFIPNPENKPQVNHKDCTRLNNHVSNLEWATSQENIRYSLKHGSVFKNGKHFNAKLTVDEVIDIKKRLANGETAYSIAKKYSHICSTIIYYIRRGRIWKQITI